jgi:uncharacterized protein (TIGR03437 family)
MKHLGLFFLCSMTALPADFLTGQAARITIGQSTFTSQDSGFPSAYQVGGVDGVAYANNTLVVVDSNHIQALPVNNRVLIYENISRYIYNPTSEIPQGSRCPVCISHPNVGGADLVLGQPNFVTTTNPYLTQNGFRNPTSVATNGQLLVLADTDNNRVLIWKSIPTANDQPADIVLGQKDFTSVQSPPVLNSTSFRGPEGVWLQGNQLFVADTQNHRVLIWNSIPTSNNQAADLVLGEPNFTTAPAPTLSDLPPQSNNLFSPVSVTSDGTHLFVSDLGHNRILIWNSIPTQNQQAADVVVGQPDMVSEASNNVLGTCVSNGTDSDNNPTFPSGCKTVCPATGTDADGNSTYPARCGLNVSFPRFALSDGQRLFIADAGNDRVLIYNKIPTQNGTKADVILGQPDEFSEQVTDPTSTFRPDATVLSSAPNTIRTPMALAWDGTNLFVSDPFDRRVLVFTLGSPNIPITGITNAASLATYAIGTVNLSGTITATDTVTITINSTKYTYTVVKNDTLITIGEALINLINGVGGTKPDPNVIAVSNLAFSEIVLTSRTPGLSGNNVGYSAAAAVASGSTSVPTEAVRAGGASLAGGAAAAEIGPGTLVTMTGANLADAAASAVPSSDGSYPTTLAGVQVYFDGIQSPVLYVSPTQINAQLPFEVADANGVSAFVRTVHNDGTVTATTAVSIPVVPENPGIFAMPGNDPRPGIAYHASAKAIAAVSLDGSVTAGNALTIKIDGRAYTYKAQATDTLATVRDALIELINANPNEVVTASPAGEFTRIILTAKVSGPAGNGIAITIASSAGATVTLSPLGSGMTCCASAAGTRVTPDNPAVPGEVITIYATGLGPATLLDGSAPAGITGQIYQGPALNSPQTPVDNAQVGGSTANVLASGLKPGLLGVYEVRLQLSTSLPTNPKTQIYIAQNVFTSNIVTIPVVAIAPGQ